MDDVSKFNTTKYVESVVAASPTVSQAADVTVKSVQFQVEQKYSFANTVTSDEATTAIADLHGVNPATVSVTKEERRLRRRLNTVRSLSDVASFTAIVTTESASEAAAIAIKAVNKSAVTASLKSTLGLDTDPAVAVDGVPKKTVTVDVELSTAGIRPLSQLVPPPDALSEELTAKFGTSATASVEKVRSTELNEMVDAAVGLRHSFVFFSCLVAMLVTHT